MRKFFKVFGIILLILLAIIAGALIYINYNAESIADRLLTKYYQEQPVSKVYEISYRDINLDLWSASVVFHDLKIKPLQSFFDGSDSIRFRHPVVFDAQIEKLAVNGLARNLSFNLKKIHFGTIRISGPHIVMIEHLTDAEKQTAKELQNAQHADTSSSDKNIKGIAIRRFILSGGSFSRMLRTQNLETLAVADIDINIRKIDLPFGKVAETLAADAFARTEVHLREINYKLPKGFYEIVIQKVDISGTDSLITLSELQLIPQYDKKEFGKKMGYQTDRMELNVPTLEIRDFDLARFVANDTVHVRNIVIAEASLVAYRDKNVPFDHSRRPKLPQQMLAALPLPVDIEKVEVKNASILYQQLDPYADAPGEVPITRLYGTIYNVTNIRPVISRRGAMMWDVQAIFFGDGKMKVEITFPANLHCADFSFNASMGSMPAVGFNQMIVPTEGVKIEQGTINSLWLRADAGEESAAGPMVLNYANLKVAVLKDNPEKSEDKSGLLSLLANIVINSSNQNPADTATMYFERDKERSIFNYLAKTVVSGLKATVLPGRQNEDKKAQRTERREERKARRAK
ncbi:MAG: hypothetical protein RBR47_03435 [Bacteroidales bacterium]|nr:hypothetical protein [Bacteroidales bacterium]MDD4176013.1 hypothetical protein [Bacteroidales bacterium]MDD4741348.1 hypothetical protein [Bacteroidales bacterium]MDY0333989.1 hypothetical protein [Bacteroidales bacterium]